LRRDGGQTAVNKFGFIVSGDDDAQCHETIVCDISFKNK
jgi:hypothetical protein